MNAVRRPRAHQQRPVVEQLESISLLSGGLAGTIAGLAPSLGHQGTEIQRASPFARSAAKSDSAQPKSVQLVAINPATGRAFSPHAKFFSPGETIRFQVTARNATGKVVALPPGSTVIYRLNGYNPSNPVARLTQTGQTAALVILPANGSSFVGIVSVSATVQVPITGTFDGTYTGGYSGTVSGYGYTEPVQGGVGFSVNGSTVSVTVPESGTGRLTSTGVGDFSGTSGSLPGATFEGQFTHHPDGSVTASGSWTASSDGVTGSGTWSATRTGLPLQVERETLTTLPLLVTRKY